MELKILSPQEGGFVKEIRWNNEELKAEIAEKMQEYKSLAFTEETIKEAKADRAKLNKLRTAFEDERKKIKKQCMEPYEKFEQQVKELIALIDEPIRLIDNQIKEVEQKKKEEKRQRIESMFDGIGFQTFVTLGKIWDDKWLNASVPLGKIEEQMKSRMYQIGTEILTIKNLPEFSFEAMEVYKKTLNLTEAIQEGQRLADIAKRKAEYEKRKAEEEARKLEESERTARKEKETSEVKEVDVEHKESPAPEIMRIDFRVWGTREQIMSLRQYLIENNIKFGKVE